MQTLKDLSRLRDPPLCWLAGYVICILLVGFIFACITQGFIYLTYQFFPQKTSINNVSVEKWETAQSAELGAWIRGGQKECREVPKLSEWTMKRFGFKQDQFENKVLLDIGPGPVNRLVWLRGEFIAIEPLYNQLKDLPYANFDKYSTVYTVPAEHLQTHLIEQVDQVMCINVLDHCYDAEQVLRNIHIYLKPGEHAFISVDCDDFNNNDPFHPLQFSSEKLEQLIRDVGLIIIKHSQGRCTPNEDCWGHGTAHHFWLKKGD